MISGDKEDAQVIKDGLKKAEGVTQIVERQKAVLTATRYRSSFAK